MEIWKDVKGYEGLYQVSNLGRLKSLKRKVKNRWGFYYTKEKIVGGYDNDGYVAVKLTKKKKEFNTTIHKIVAINFLNHSYESTLVVDHINNIRDDNRLENLQVITNRLNCSKDVKNKTSKYTGVSWSKNRKKWHSKIKIKGKTINLGRYENEYEAHLAYQKALKQL